MKRRLTPEEQSAFIRSFGSSIYIACPICERGRVEARGDRATGRMEPECMGCHTRWDRSMPGTWAVLLVEAGAGGSGRFRLVEVEENRARFWKLEAVS
jgi:transposase-like protein